MKILSLHCDYLKFKPVKKALKNVSELQEDEKKGVVVSDPLGIFIAVEKQDEVSLDKSVNELVKACLDLMKQVRAKKVVLYPYAHLSSSLANPGFALQVLELSEGELKEKKIEVYRAPFGYYKEFELKCKGHPLAELSREIKIEGGEVGGKTEEDYDYHQLLRQISKTNLDTSKLKENDHRIIGQKMDLFSFSETAPGMVFWHHNGWVIYQELLKFWREEHQKTNYKEISTPQILDEKLWQISGHWEKFRENIFLTDYEKRKFAVKPMNCPGGMLVYKNGTKSYKDLPLRVAEVGIVHRQELSGVLGGLFRVIQFTQDDAHIFCTEQQLEKEISDVFDMVDMFYKKFKFSYHVELSTRPEKRIGSEEIWNKAEEILSVVLKNKKVKYKINKGDGAFYGPKIDFHLKDSLNRTWQLGTIQLDFAMPERFNLEYAGKDNAKYRPIILHRAIYGSLERFIGVLLEHTSGNLPVWLAPVQVRVMSFTDRNIKSGERVLQKLREAGIRVDGDFESSGVSEKVRNAELQKIPYVVVIGDKEEEKKTLAVREKGKKPKFGIKLEKFINDVQLEIKERK